jgi:negative regulator of flagellin synthesis FlgM
MAIEITGLPNSAINNDGLDSTKTKSNSSAQTETDAKTSTTTDAVTITNQATKIKALEDSVSTQSVVDIDRVAELKDAIDSGAYQVDPQRVAEKFLQFESSLVA